MPAVSYREILFHAPLPFAVTDEAGTIVEANEAFVKATGIRRQFLLGKPLVALSPPQYQRTIRQAILGAIREGSNFEWEQELHHRGGDVLPVHVLLTPIGTDAGTFLGWVLQDIRDRVAMERRLRRLTSDLEGRILERTDELETERARLGSIISQMPAGVVLIDAPDGNLILVNEEALRILRVDDELGLGEGAPEWHARRLDGSPIEPDDEPLQRSLRGEVITGERVQVTAGDGTPLVLDVSAAPVRDTAGRVIGAASVFTDLTTRERREQAEREFVMNAAHELQTPLAALISSVEVLLVGAKDSPERDLFLSHVAREAERLTRIVRSLLVLARAEVGAEEPFLELVDLEAMLARIAGDLRPAKGVVVRFEAEPGIAIVSNVELLEQAVSNLGQNAAKYTSAGEIVLEARTVDGVAEIAVRDTGPGIAEEDQRRVFERFYRGVGNEGAGLGLAIVRAAVEALGGNVSLESTVGKGTVITLRVPKATTLVFE